VRAEAAEAEVARLREVLKRLAPVVFALEDQDRETMAALVGETP
jgi:hypothetical protein